MKKCRCSRYPAYNGDDLLEVFAAVRQECPALNQVFVPDELWPRFEQWHHEPDSAALHKSMLLLAMKRGYLARATSAVHRFLLEGSDPRPDVKVQYLKDLRERWMLDDGDPIECHRKARMFSGRLAELQFAEWLELQGWTISGLEATGQKADIQARANDGRSVTFEVKLIGTDDEVFAEILECIAGRPSGGSLSLYDATDYLLFRLYEAAKQLQRNNCGRVAVIVIEESTLFRFDLQLELDWIDWANAKFFLEHDFEEFLKDQACYPKILDELQSVLESLNEIWVFSRSVDFQFHGEFKYGVGRKCRLLPEFRAIDK